MVPEFTCTIGPAGLLETLKTDVPAVCKSINNEPATLDVLVTLSFIAVKLTRELFQVWVIFRTGLDAVTVAPVIVRERLVSSHDVPDIPPNAPALLYWTVRLAPPGVPPPPAGVAHVASPRQKVVADAPDPLFRLFTDRLPVTPLPPVRTTPVTLVITPDVGVPSAGVTRVGEEDVQVLIWFAVILTSPPAWIP